MTQPSLFRRRFLVDRRLQLSLMLTSLSYTTLVLLFLAVGLFLPLALQLDDAAPVSQATTEVSTVMVYLHGRFWWILGASLVLTALGSIYASHRIAGPMVRFKRHLEQIGAGVLPPPLRVRQQDLLQAEVACLNRTVERLQERRSSALAAHQSLLAALSRCRASRDLGAMAAAIAEAQALAAALGGQLDPSLAAGADRRAPDVPPRAPGPVDAAVEVLAP